MDGMQAIMNGRSAVLTFFEYGIKEEPDSFPKMKIVAELMLDSGKIERVHHVNVDDIKHAMERAVLNAVWFTNTKVKNNAK